jgi:hypothetical protein
MKVTFNNMIKGKPFTPEQKQELKKLVKGANCDWDFSISSTSGYYAMVEYVSSYIDPKNGYPIMLQGIVAYPNNGNYSPHDSSLQVELKPVDWDIFKEKVKQYLQSAELKEYCQFCKVSHSRLFIRGSYCVLDLERKQPVVRGAVKA